MFVAMLVGCCKKSCFPFLWNYLPNFISLKFEQIITSQRNIALCSNFKILVFLFYIYFNLRASVRLHDSTIKTHITITRRTLYTHHHFCRPVLRRERCRPPWSTGTCADPASSGSSTSVARWNLSSAYLQTSFSRFPKCSAWGLRTKCTLRHCCTVTGPSLRLMPRVIV